MGFINVVVDIVEVAYPNADRSTDKFYLAKGPDGRERIGVLHVGMGDTALVRHVYVARRWRRMGVAKQLLAFAASQTGLELVHDGETSDAGDGLMRAANVRPLYNERVPLDAAVVEETGLKLLGDVVVSHDREPNEADGWLRAEGPFDPEDYLGWKWTEVTVKETEHE